ncbi:MAG: hypothetical protein IJC16_06525 [Rikenellaceae bacterium]|nr:hypothetical protein [Rikenellaceae bacterium]
MKKAIILGAAFLLAGGPSDAGRPASAWLRGNTHTAASDGDTPVQQVVDRYHDHGCRFLLITDHNVTLRPGEVDMTGRRADFVLIPGNEISENSIHVTAANVTAPMTPVSIREACGRDGAGGEGETDGAGANPGAVTLFASHIAAAGGMAFINHPNFADGVEVADILPVRNITHLEVFNPDSVCYNWGNERFIPVEGKWDGLLTAGRLIYAVAVDDAQHFREIRRQNCCPGRGWIMVDAGSADPDEILGAIAEGRFYASSSVLLDRCAPTGGRIAVKADEAATRAEVTGGCPRTLPTRDARGSRSRRSAVGDRC